MTASKGLVLVTGANGFVAARTVEAFLKAGYSVRGTVRSKASAAGLLAALPEYASSGALEIVEVPDVTVPGAFDEAVKGATGIAHLASPVSLFFTDADMVINTATKATAQVLESAAKEPSVKSFVYMSSIVAVRKQVEGPYVFTEADWNDQAVELAVQLGNNAPGSVIYSASKVAAEKIFWRFRDERKPTFTMSALHPVFVTGPPLVLPESADGLGETIRYIWDVYSGKDIPEPLGGFAYFVDIRDVARLTLLGIDQPEKLDGERLIASAHWGPPQAAADILREAMPERRDIIKAGNPGEGYAPGFKLPSGQTIDGTKAVRVSGQEYISYEKSVIDTAKAFERYL